MLLLQGEGCSGELCREDWLEQVCGFPSSGMKEVREGDPQARPLGGGLWRSLCRFRPEAGSWWCERGAPVEQGELYVVICEVGGAPGLEVVAGSSCVGDDVLFLQGGRCVAGPVPEEWS